MAADRIRVFIAGNIYVKRALVRRFLEDDGYDVVGEARDREDMVTGVRREQPDAVVVDDELLADGPGGGTLGRLRRGAPDARVVVFTDASTDGPAAAEGADGYLEKGLGLASLTAMLGRLFAHDAPATAVAPGVDPGLAETIDLGREPTLVSAGAAEAGTTHALGVDAFVRSDASSPDGSSPTPARRPGVAVRVAAIGVGVVMVLSGLVAMIASDSDRPAPRALDRTESNTPVASSPSAAARSPLDEAYATLDDLVGALRQGNYVLATVDAQTLMDQRETARSTGFALTGLDAEIGARLEQLVGDLPSRVNTGLVEILGSLYPDVPAPADQPGGGSDVVIGAVVPSSTTSGGTGSTPADTPSGGADQPGGGQTDGGGQTGGDQTGGGGQTGSGDGGGGGETPTPLGPGDGRAWGQSHHPDGGWHGENPHDRTEQGKPPWAGGPH